MSQVRSRVELCRTLSSQKSSVARQLRTVSGVLDSDKAAEAY